MIVIPTEGVAVTKSIVIPTEGVSPSEGTLRFVRFFFRLRFR